MIDPSSIDHNRSRSHTLTPRPLPNPPSHPTHPHATPQPNPTHPTTTQVWTHYAPYGSLGDFARPQNRSQALACLNHLVTDALQHVPDCLEYMSRLRTPEIFRFCAIPQVMAIATLDKVYANADVFTGVVKIRKGLACKLILEANDMPQLYACFAQFAGRIAARCHGLQGPALAGTPTQQRTLALCDQIRGLCTNKAGAALQQQGAIGGAGVVGLVLLPVLAVMASFLPPNLSLATLSGLSAADCARIALCLLASLVLTVGLSAVVLAVFPPAGSSGSSGNGSSGKGGSRSGGKRANGGRSSAVAGKAGAMMASQ
jgi:uncharacterized membrane protein YgcG